MAAKPTVVVAMRDLTHGTYDLTLLETSRKKWDESSSLRCYYKSVFDQLLSIRKKGPTLELGSGCAFIKDVDPTIVTSDVKPTPYADCVVDAYSIENLSKTWSNIIAIDVLHHLTKPLVFFKSASRCLEQGGKIILCEPAATMWGRVFYSACHHEPCRPSDYLPPFEFAAEDKGLFANMGAGRSLFETFKNLTMTKLSRAGLRLEKLAYRDIIGYPLTGGLSKPSLVNKFLLKLILRIENKAPQPILKYVGLRMIVELKKF